MIKIFEKFNLFKDVMNKFNKLAHIVRLSSNRDMEKDYHLLVRKFNISYVGVIQSMTPPIVSELEKELDVIIEKYPQLKEGIENADDPKVGKEFWFEYHCLESPDSQDAEMWYHSHQKCTVLEVSELGGVDMTKEERMEEGEPRVYKVRFEDGYEWSAFEDEILDSPEEFERPDPPKKK